MDYRIVAKDAFPVICRKKQVFKPQGDMATADISAFWNECGRNGTIEAICKYADFHPIGGLMASASRARWTIPHSPTGSARPTTGPR